MNEEELARSTVQQKIDRRQKLVSDLKNIYKKINEIEDKLYCPENYTSKEYDALVNERRGLLILAENKENSLKYEFPFKDIETVLEQLNKNQENENKI